MQKIGPTFPEELKAAGLMGMPFAWGEDGTFSFAAEMSTADVSKVKAVYAAHNPMATLPDESA